MQTTTLDKIFAATVARGWKPTAPAFEPELSLLEASFTRGDCIAPLIVEGDLAYIDTRTPAQPGDLVSFALSARGAAAQNSALPAGQSPWKKGDRWIKLLARYHDWDMLLDRHARAATATLLGGEHQDDHPALWPVRNIRRNGKLLYGPDSHAAEIGLAAVTDVLSATITSATIGTAGGAGHNLTSLTVGPYPWATEVIATVSGYIEGDNTSATLQAAAWGTIFINNSASDFTTNPNQFSGGYVPTSTIEEFSFSCESVFSLAAATTKTFYVNGINTGGTGMVETFTSGIFKIEVIKR
jgi:hypothetical protein